MRLTIAATIDSTTESRSIDVIGMYTLVFGRSMRMSPGRRPNHERAPDQARIPRRASPPPARIKNRDVETGAEVQRFVHPPTVHIYSVDYSPDGKSILIGGFDFESPTSSSPVVQTWDIQTGEKTQEILSLPSAMLQRVAFSPDGQTILTAQAHTSDATLWSKAGRFIHGFMGHTVFVNGAAFSPDGQTVATASSDRTVRLWETKTGKEIRRFLGHSVIVHSVPFSPDGKALATASADGTARLWDVQTGEELRRYVGHEARVENVTLLGHGVLGIRTRATWRAEFSWLLAELVALPMISLGASYAGQRLVRWSARRRMRVVQDKP